MKLLLRLFKRNPLAFILSSTLALAVIAATLVSFAAIFISVTAPRILRDKFWDATEFSMLSDNIFVNIFTGSVEIDNLRISPPKEFDETDYFLVADKVNFKILPWEFLKGRLVITEMSIDAQKLSRVKIVPKRDPMRDPQREPARDSMKDFFYSFPAFAEFSDAKDFKFFRLSVDEIKFTDKSTAEMKLPEQKSLKRLELEITDISNAAECKKAAEKAFEEAGAFFVLPGVNL